MMTPNDSIPASQTAAIAPVAVDGLLQGYAAAADSDDEMWDVAAGGVRHSWQTYINAIGALGPEILERRHREIRRLLRENGVTYNVHGDPDGLHRPWELDPIPMIIASDDWDRLEIGLSQRAQLMDLIFADLYGARTLLKEGLLPPELVYGHPGFLRACDGIRHPGDRQITFLAVDLARGPDRQFQVVGDRVQAPSGAGYALENRTVMARVFPDLIRDCRVRRLAQFFRTLRTALTADRSTAQTESRYRCPDPRPGQRDLLRAGLPGGLPRVHPGAGRRSDGSQRDCVAQSPGWFKTARRAAATG